MFELNIQNIKNTLIEGALYVVSTPIGNLADISFRALGVLNYCDFIFAEDTRVTNKLLNYYNIYKPTYSLHEHNEVTIANKIVKLLTQGKIIAQVSDAGTPSISDPGAKLVKKVLQSGFKVIPISGCSALITAFSVSGIESREFYFKGFLPSKKNEKERLLKELINIKSPIILYETSHRILDTLIWIDNLMPTRNIVLARELTKLYETFLHGLASDLIKILRADNNQLKGEFVLILDKNNDVDYDSFNINDQIIDVLKLLSEKLPPKQVALIVSKLTGLNKKELYELIINK